jgi:hypothetical protein
MSPVELVVMLFTLVIALAVAARRLPIPLPLVLAAGGVVLGALEAAAALSDLYRWGRR